MRICYTTILYTAHPNLPRHSGGVGKVGAIDIRVRQYEVRLSYLLEAPTGRAKVVPRG